jgi:hypothetical protein
MAIEKHTTLTVPKSVDNLIQFVIESGISPAELASHLDFRHTDAIYRLRRYEYAPKVATAEKLGALIGWTAGEVIDHWLSKVIEKEATR